MEIPRKELLKENAILWLLIVVLIPLLMMYLQMGNQQMIITMVVMITVVIIVKEILEEKSRRIFIEDIVSHMENKEILGEDEPLKFLKEDSDGEEEEIEEQLEELKAKG